MHANLGTRSSDQFGQAATMVDVGVRNEDPPQISQSKRLVELGGNGFQTAQNVGTRFRIPAAGIDERWWTCTKQQVHPTAEIRHKAKRNPVNPHPNKGNELLNRR
jgi:hypothetical protein